MARVAFENHAPSLAAALRPGDILIVGRNFGCGSSREQAVTALQAAGIVAVVAADFSRTYLRNAYNNAFLCLECPALFQRLRERLADRVADGESHLIGSVVTVDFLSSTIALDGETFGFPPLDDLPQELVACGGLENRLRDALAARGGDPGNEE